MKRAEDIKFVADEDGWEMHVTDDAGFVQRYNIHGVAWKLVGHLNETVGDWYREGLAAAISLHRDDGDEVDYDLARDMAREAAYDGDGDVASA